MNIYKLYSLKFKPAKESLFNFIVNKMHFLFSFQKNISVKINVEKPLFTKTLVLVDEGITKVHQSEAIF